MDSGGPLTTGEVAGLCHVSQVTVFRWIKRGLLSAYCTPGGHYRIQCAHLVEFLERQNMPVPETLDGKSHAGKRVLLVDDDPAVLETLKRVLSTRNGLVLEEAAGGLEACLKIGAGKPDLVVLNHAMPEHDGFEVVREVRSNPETRACKILMLSGYGSEENRERALALGANAFLEKPIEGPELLTSVNSLLGEDA